MMDAECIGDLVVPCAKSSESCAVWTDSMVCIPDQEKDNHYDPMALVINPSSIYPLPSSLSSCFFPFSLLPPLSSLLSPPPSSSCMNMLLGNINSMNETKLSF